MLRPLPARGGQPCPRQISPIRLSVAETARLAALAKQHAAGPTIDRSRLAFALRWSRRPRQHQAIARWHHYSARLASASSPILVLDEKEMTPCNRNLTNRPHATLSGSAITDRKTVTVLSCLRLPCFRRARAAFWDSVRWLIGSHWRVWLAGCECVRSAMTRVIA